LCGYTLEGLIFGPENCTQKWRRLSRTEIFSNPTEEQREAMAWAVNATAWRRLMGTCGGRMGLAPAAARVGDRVAVLVGCRTPIVLRREGLAGWSVVGECFVHGAMYGEVVPMGETSLERISLL
jgi:hypothetical protein